VHCYKPYNIGAVKSQQENKPNVAKMRMLRKGHTKQDRIRTERI